MYHPNLSSPQKHGLIGAILILTLLALLSTTTLQAQDLIWAKRAGGSSFSDIGFGIAGDGSGNSYVTGIFGGSATFGPGEANETTLTTAGSVDIFVAKYDVNGALVWAKRAGGSDSDVGLGIAVDNSGVNILRSKEVRCKQNYRVASKNGYRGEIKSIGAT